MRILIVGGGVAGLTLAALLRQRGQLPMVVEKVDSYSDAGYLLSLWPMGNRVLHGLGLYQEFQELSVPVNRYVVHDETGRVVKTFNWGGWMERHGEVRTLLRADLLKSLRSYRQQTPVKMSCTVNRIDQRQDVVHVSFSDGSEHEFDLVVGADGIHSRVRELVFGSIPLSRTGWMIASLWFDPGLPHDQAHEYWGRDRCFGIYPGKSQVACAPIFRFDRTTNGSSPVTASKLRQQFSGFGGALLQQILSQIDGTQALPCTELADVKLAHWNNGRVLLIGDAAAGFLPTAGVGASMAMESAAVLNDVLSRVDARYIPNAISAFTARRRARIDALQSESRRFLKFMLPKSSLLTSLRNRLVRRLSEDKLLKDISLRITQPI
jgi:2-polyprenyl-6-methoxyphenol hydroxylase-like FAD-dependent oxidoreductase